MLRRLAISAIALTLTAASPTPPASPPQRNAAGGEQQKAEVDQRGTKASPLVVVVLRTEADDREAKQAARERAEDSQLHRALVYLAGALTLATLGLGWFTYKLWRETRRAVTEAQVGVKAAQDSAKAADDSVKIAEDTARHQLRAYVGISAPDADVRALVGLAMYRVEYRVRALNSGQTPARELISSINVREAPSPLPDSFDFKLDRGHTPSVGVLHPTADQTLRGAARVSMQDWSRMTGNNPHTFHYVYGRIDYIDVFERPRYTNFCYQVTWDGNKPQWRTTQRHNDAS